MRIKIYKENKDFSLNNHLLNEAIKLKQKINRMILTNGFLYFLTHIPEFVMTMFMLILDRKYSDYFMFRFSFTELIELAQSFNFISFTLQIFVFLHFDKNFRQSLKNIEMFKKQTSAKTIDF